MNRPGIDCGSTCSELYDLGMIVSLTENAAEGSHFAGWSGDYTPAGMVKMSRDRSCNAIFNSDFQTLTIERVGTGNGTVTSAPAGIDCGATCSAPYDHGTEVTLSATPAVGSHFVAWTGDCSAVGVVTMEDDRICTAEFELDAHILSVSKTGTGNGTVTSAPAGIDCGATCSALFGHGTEVELIATADSGSFLAGWSGDSDCTDGQIFVDSDKGCIAVFNVGIPEIFADGFESGDTSAWQ